MQRLSFLVGRWRGMGTGILPHNGTFQFEEELNIESIGQPNFAYAYVIYSVDLNIPIINYSYCARCIV